MEPGTQQVDVSVTVARLCCPLPDCGWKVRWHVLCGGTARSFTHYTPLPQIVQKTVAYYPDIESLVVGQVRALELLHLNSRGVGRSMLTEKWSEVNFPHDNEYFTDPLTLLALNRKEEAI